MKKTLLGMLAALLLPLGHAEAAVYIFDFASYDGNYQVKADVVTSDTPQPATNTAQGGSENFGYKILSFTGNVFGPGGVGGGPIIGPAPIDNPNYPNRPTNHGFIYDNNDFHTAPYLNLWGVLFNTNEPSGPIWNLWGTGVPDVNDYELYTY